jgi:hypothetical protein
MEKRIALKMWKSSIIDGALGGENLYEYFIYQNHIVFLTNNIL